MVLCPSSCGPRLDRHNYFGRDCLTAHRRITPMISHDNHALAWDISATILDTGETKQSALHRPRRERHETASGSQLTTWQPALSRIGPIRNTMYPDELPRCISKASVALATRVSVIKAVDDLNCVSSRSAYVPNSPSKRYECQAGRQFLVGRTYWRQQSRVVCYAGLLQEHSAAPVDGIGECQVEGRGPIECRPCTRW